MRKKFEIWHSLLGMAALLVGEWLLLSLTHNMATALVLGVAVVGGIANLYMATEIVEEVRNARHMFVLLSVVTLEYIIFFAFQFSFLLGADPASYPTLLNEPTSLLLQSIMVFVFNPLYMPATAAGRVLLLIETFTALGLVLFILQNVSQLHRKVQNTQ